jgi:hypothetical protein
MIRIELSNDLKTWVSQINGRDLYDYCVQNSINIKKGYSYGAKHLTNTFSFVMNSNEATSKTVQSYRYCRCRKDDVVEFIGVADDNAASVTIEFIDNIVTTMKYRDISSTFDDASFSEPSENPYDDDQIALEITATDNVTVCNPADQTHSLVHILFSHLSAETGLSFTMDCSVTLDYTVQYFSAKVGDSVLDVITKVLTEAGLTYWCDTLTVHIVDILAEKSTGVTISDVESNATIQKKPWIETAPPAIKYPSVVERTNQRLWELGQRNDGFYRLYWKDGDNVATLSAPDNKDEDGHKMEAVAFYNFSYSLDCSAKEIKFVNQKRLSFKTVSFNIDNTHHLPVLGNIEHWLRNAF